MKRRPLVLAIAGLLVAAVAAGVVVAVENETPDNPGVADNPGAPDNPGAAKPDGAAGKGEARPGTAPRAPVTADVTLAVGEIIDRVWKAKKGLRLGLPAKQVPAIAPGAVEILDEYYLPLEGSSFAPKGDWKGVVKLIPLDRHAPLDEIRVSLLVGEYDRKVLLEFLKKKAKAIGIRDFQRDGASREFVWWGTDEENRDFWVGLGPGIVALEFTEY